MTKFSRRSRKSSLRERLLGKAIIDFETGCWNWQAAIDRYGYGKVSINRRDVGAHRAVYELIEGPIPAGLQIDHLCRNRACVNPAHLEPVTMAENQRRSPINFMITNAEKTHCVNGHEFVSENTYAYRGGRFCKTCNRENVRRYRAAHLEEVNARQSAYKRRKRETSAQHDSEPTT